MSTRHLTADFCRVQEALQRAKADSEPLESRRKIALTAAKAWEAEAILRDGRCASNARLDALDAKIRLEFASEAALLEAAEGGSSAN